MIHVRATETLEGGRVRFTLEADAPGLLAIFGPTPLPPGGEPRPDDCRPFVVFVESCSTWEHEHGGANPTGRELVQHLTARWQPRARLALGFEAAP